MCPDLARELRYAQRAVRQMIGDPEIGSLVENLRRDERKPYAGRQSPLWEILG
jgi:hypothetical protein